MDREWVIADSNGDTVWQGSHPRLALVRPAISGNTLVLNVPDMPSVNVSRAHAENTCRIRIWNDIEKISETYEGFDAGPEAAALLRAATGADLRLVRLGRDGRSRNSVNPVHLCSASSMQELNHALAAQGDKPIDILRLRPNIVFSGVESPLMPFLEEQFTVVRWMEEKQEADIAIHGSCFRCIVPNVDPVTAEVSNEPADAIARLSAQRYPGEPSRFGVYGRAGGAFLLREGAVLTAELNF